MNIYIPLLIPVPVRGNFSACGNLYRFRTVTVYTTFHKITILALYCILFFGIV